MSARSGLKDQFGGGEVVVLEGHIVLHKIERLAILGSLLIVQKKKGQILSY